MKINASASQNKIPETFAQRSAQTPPRPAPQCGGSFYEPPRITPPRRFNLPSWARTGTRERPSTPSILPFRMNHGFFRFGYEIPADRGNFEDVYAGRTILHESFLQNNDGPRAVRVGIRYETDRRVVIELQTGGGLTGTARLLTQLDSILNRLACQLRSLPPGTQFIFDIPYPR